MGTEFELKYRAPHPGVLDEILRGRRPAEFDMVTTYFDTPEGSLSAQKWTLRVRKENDASIVTCKTPGENHVRGEWETPAQEPLGALETLVALGAPKELLEIQSLVPVCGAKFHRRAVTLDLGDARVELACDQGVLTGGGRELPIWEVEVELKSGNPDSVTHYAQELARHYHLVAESKSKFQRANALSGRI